MPDPKTRMEESAFNVADLAALYVLQFVTNVRNCSEGTFHGWTCTVPCGDKETELAWYPAMDLRYSPAAEWARVLAFVGKSHMEARDRLRDEITATREAHREKVTELEQHAMQLGKINSELAATIEALRWDLTKLESNQGGDRGDLMRLLGVAETAADIAEDENTARAWVRIVAGLSSALGVESEMLEDDS